jgi:transposase
VTVHAAGRVPVDPSTLSGALAMTSAPAATITVGIDWATRAHEVCALDSTGRVLGRREFPNTPEGLEALVAWMLSHAGGDRAALVAAIERPDGLVVEALLDHDIAVWTINPKQLDRFRDRFTPCGAKDDRRDARVLADAVRTDRPAFRQVGADPPAIVALRGLVREDDALRIEETALNNRLRDLLGRYHPRLLELAADRVDPLLWDLWELAPTPGAAAAVSRRAVAAALRRHRIRRLDTEAVMRTLTASAPRVAEATVAVAEQAVGRLLPRLRLAHAQRQECGHRIEALLQESEAPGEGGQHSDATVLRSLPGVGRAVLARVLTEGAEAIRRRDLTRLRALGGSAPVTRRSGQSCRVAMRRACSGRLRFAYYHWARTAVQNDERSRAHYAALRAGGQSHGRALRGVVDRLLAVAVAMLRAGTLYDPGLRSSLAARAQGTGAGRRTRLGVCADRGAGA